MLTACLANENLKNLGLLHPLHIYITCCTNACFHYFVNSYVVSNIFIKSYTDTDSFWIEGLCEKAELIARNDRKNILLYSWYFINKILLGAIIICCKLLPQRHINLAQHLSTFTSKPSFLGQLDMEHTIIEAQSYDMWVCFIECWCSMFHIILHVHDSMTENMKRTLSILADALSILKRWSRSRSHLQLSYAFLSYFLLLIQGCRRSNLTIWGKSCPA